MISERVMKVELAVKLGSLFLKSIRMHPRRLKVELVEVTLEGQQLTAKLVQKENGASIEFDAPISIAAGQTATVVLR